jgi:hypothetical protein
MAGETVSQERQYLRIIGRAPILRTREVPFHLLGFINDREKKNKNQETPRLMCYLYLYLVLFRILYFGRRFILANLGFRCYSVGELQLRGCDVDLVKRPSNNAGPFTQRKGLTGGV